MAIQPINYLNSRPLVNFKSQTKQEYENPIDRKTERNLAILSSAGVSTLTGLIAGGITSLCVGKGHGKISYGIGIGAGLLTLALTLPPRLYNAKVGAFTREKEVDVFSRQKDAQSNIYEDINNEIQDEDISLDQKINHYSTVKMADNGRGLIVKGV